MSDKDDMAAGAPPGDGPVPRLTIGQRVLASLPNLQREAKTSPGTPAGAPARNGAADSTDVVTPDAVLAPRESPPPARTAPTAGTTGDTRRSPAATTARGTPSGMTKDELTHIIKKIDDRERTIAYGSAVMGVAVAAVLTIAAVHLNLPKHAKVHIGAGTIIFEGAARVVLAAVVVLAAWYRRRSFVAFALLFLGTSMGGLFALPFWVVGIWLIFRVFKWQKELTALTRGQAAARPAASARGRGDAATRSRDAAEARRQARAERMRARGAGGRRGKKEPEPTGPPPNKRYTPPRQTRQRPPAS